MRSDLALYGVAIVLFFVAVVVYIIVPADQGQLVYTIGIIVLGLLMLATGFVLRQKPNVIEQVQPESTPSPPQPPVAEPIQQTSPDEVPVAPAPIEQAETPVAKTPPPKPSAETPNPPKEEVPMPVLQMESVAAAPVLNAPEPTPQLSAPTEPPALSAVTPAAGSELTSIIGINAKRAEQLKANGINTVDDLAKALPEELASKIGVSPKIVKMWVGTAKKRAK